MRQRRPQAPSSTSMAARAPSSFPEGRLRLARSRATATALLVLMALIYASTLFVPSPGFWVLLLRAAAEAGVVGGLADWFAVTALFRHPLGLPIPHTAIIPRNQYRLGEALGRFIEQNFITRDLVVGKIRDAGIGRMTTRWLAARDTPKAASDWIVGSLPYLIRMLENRDVHAFVDQALGEQLRRANLAPTLARLLRAAAGTREADALIDLAVDSALEQIDQRRETILDLVRERSRWWIPKAVNRRIAAGIADGLTELLDGLREPDSQGRRALRSAIDHLAEELMRSPDTAQQLNGAIERLLTVPDIRVWLAALWRELSSSALSDLADPASSTRAFLETAIASLGQALASDDAVIAGIDRAAERAALILVLRRDTLGRLVAEVVRGWDSATLTDRIELSVGSDLQFIRINGTLVGALIGGTMFLLAAGFETFH